MTQFRMDNTEGYSQDELDVLNEAFEIAYAAYGVPADAHEDFVSDTRQYIGEKVESYWMPGMTADELVKAYKA